MTAVTTERITTDHGPSVLVVHIDDGKANALSRATIAEIMGALDEAEGDESVGAVVLHGRPGKFSAGFDLSVMGSGDWNAVATLMCDGGDLVRRIYGLQVPVVAACTGHALAAGAFLLLAADLRIGADVACKIGLNEVAIGIVLPDWAITMCNERLSMRHLQRAVLLAEVTGPAGAVDAGFLDEVVPEADVLATAVARASGYAAFTRAAYHGSVVALRGPALALLEQQVDKDRPRA
jgi:enoyl-CoA hydratase